jgi:phosphoribosyl-AMP cyclohydrolase / phosphoribosyl-ATP pyrophosphohydrolase
MILKFSMTKNNSDYLTQLFAEIKRKATNAQPHESYSAYLTSLGAESIGKKLMEEAFELSVANIEFENDSKKRPAVVYEAADVVYHMLALLVSRNIEFSEIIEELKKRSKSNVDVMVSNTSKKSTKIKKK